MAQGVQQSLSYCSLSLLLFVCLILVCLILFSVFFVCVCLCVCVGGGVAQFRGFCETDSGQYGVDLPVYIHPQAHS